MKSFIGKSLLIIIGLCLIGGRTADAGSSVEQKIKVIPMPATSEEFDSQIRLARQLIKRKDYRGAAAVLEPLFSKIPDQSLTYNLLRQCYDKLGYLPKVQDLANRMINEHPNECRYYLDLGRVQMQMQESQAGLESFYKAAQLAKTAISAPCTFKGGRSEVSKYIARATRM